MQMLQLVHSYKKECNGCSLDIALFLLDDPIANLITDKWTLFTSSDELHNSSILFIYLTMY